MKSKNTDRWTNSSNKLTTPIKKGTKITKLSKLEAKNSVEKLLFQHLVIDDSEALKAETIKQRILFMEHIGIVDFLFENYNLEGKDSKVAIILGLISDIKPNTISRELGNIRNELKEVSVDKLSKKEIDHYNKMGKLKKGAEKIIIENDQHPTNFDYEWLKEQYDLLDIEPLKKLKLIKK